MTLATQARAIAARMMATDYAAGAALMSLAVEIASYERVTNRLVNDAREQEYARYTSIRNGVVIQLYPLGVVV